MTMKKLGSAVAVGAATALLAGCFPGSYHNERHGAFTGDPDLHMQYRHTKARKHAVSHHVTRKHAVSCRHHVKRKSYAGCKKQHRSTSCSHGSCKS